MIGGCALSSIRVICLQKMISSFDKDLEMFSVIHTIVWCWQRYEHAEYIYSRLKLECFQAEAESPIVFDTIGR